ncbi:outer membrane protein [Aestuariivirga sp.]|uniref:outer membrane protein n=1 Tax=Aestuariivirga sp. TaxID=2650926 RepID=UPI003BAA3E4F
MITRFILGAGSLVLMSSSCSAADTAGAGGFYAGLFGGAGGLGDTSMEQVGTVFTPAPFPDINVDADGSADATAAGIGGLRLGYEWGGLDVSPNGWRLDLATELEGLYLGAEPKGAMPIDPQSLGTQYVSLPLGNKALLVNAVLNIRTPWSETIRPYIGGGAGYALVSVTGSNSTNPSEPGINHFNTDPDENSPALALQAKVGVSAAISDHWSVFAEFRHVTIASTSFTFGDTDYPGEHLPTSKWNVDLGRQNYNLAISGIDYHF